VKRIVVSGTPLLVFSGTSDFLRLLLASTDSTYVWTPKLSELHDFKRLVSYLILVFCRHGVAPLLSTVYSLAIGYLVRYIKIPDSKLIIVHPQSIGYTTLFKISKRNKIFASYLVDSSWFCIKSYNHIEGELIPCMRCISDVRSSCKYGCSCMWGNNIQDHYDYTCSLKAGEYGYVVVQSQTQADLFYKSGYRADLIRVIPMISESTIIECMIPSRNNSLEAAEKILNNGAYTYQVIYHANLNSAKGFDYTLAIASLNTNILFVIPTENTTDISRSIPNNVIFLPCTWSTGLRDFCKVASAILVPSLWSVPVESSLLKSMTSGSPVISLKFESYDPSTDLCSINYFFPEELLKTDSIYTLLSNGRLKKPSQSEIIEYSLKAVLRISRIFGAVAN